jgi:hypothetical protein
MTWLSFQENIASGRAGDGMLMLQQQHNPAGAAQSGGDQAELLDRLDCGVKILSGESLVCCNFHFCLRLCLGGTTPCDTMAAYIS